MRKRVLVIGGVVAAFPVAVAAWGWLANMGSSWWATAGQWVGGVGSIAAAGAALWIAAHSWSLSEKERQESQRDQARLVKISYVPTAGLHGAVQVENRNAAHINDIRLVSLTVGEHYSPGKWFIGSPLDQESRDELPYQAARDLGGRGVRSIGVFYLDVYGTVSVAEEPPTPTVTYTDGLGRAWSRTGSDEPVPYTDVTQ
ncbi:hypothetical protein [Amycolatopsis sp. NPDC052450]|uniref:hypothetical protein n=1 Tax=Amycolatopsis sp. NPDC052450 TaxID=3363937 RepID=UPI0037C9DC1A